MPATNRSKQEDVDENQQEVLEEEKLNDIPAEFD